MDDILFKYRELLKTLQEEYDLLASVVGGELLQKYRAVLEDEMEQVENNIYLFYNSN